MTRNLKWTRRVLMTYIVVFCMLLVAKTATAEARWQYSRATWYGPGFYGNHTRCGQLYTIHTRGIAVDSMACGTKLTVCRRGRCVRIRVIDGGGAFDLTARTAIDLCRCWSPYTMNVRWKRGWVYRQAARK